MKPTAVAEVCSEVRASQTLHVVGSGTKSSFETPIEAETSLEMSGISGVLAYSPEDRFIDVYAGTTIVELQQILKERGQALAIPDSCEFGALLAGVPGTVGGLVSMNLPHALNSQCGGPREWVLGLTAVRANGDLIYGGGRVVKNVAGYNVHRLFVGARGTLGVIVSVVLRVYPIAAIPHPSCERVREWNSGDPLAIQRVLPTDWDEARRNVSDRLFSCDRSSSTLWYAPAEASDIRFKNDWMIYANRQTGNLVDFSPNTQMLMTATKNQLDLFKKFNPGALGCV
jgi:FAD/FMN-containing dehydrogenase